jgi:dihydrofolate reductase
MKDDTKFLVAASVCHARKQHDLVDEYSLLVYPLVLGSGKKLFAEGVRFNLRLIESRAFPSGVVLMHYAAERGA